MMEGRPTAFKSKYYVELLSPNTVQDGPIDEIEAMYTVKKNLFQENQIIMLMKSEKDEKNVLSTLILYLDK